MKNPQDRQQPLASVFAQEIARSAVWFIALGAILVVVGLAMVANPLFTGLSVATMVGVLFLVAGAMYLLNAWLARSGGGFLARLLLGILTGGAGIYIVMHPDRGLAVLTVLLGIVVGVAGLLRLLLARVLTGVPGVGGLYLSGAVSIVIAVLILAKLPSASETIIGVLLGIDMLAAGITAILLATRVRRVVSTA